MSDEFKPQRFHWWLTTIVAIVGVVAAAGGVIYTATKSDPAPAVPVVNNFLPNVNGAVGQTQPKTAVGCDNPDGQEAGWGPYRPTVTGDTSFPWPSFNSDRDNPNYGDERNSFRVKDASNVNAGGFTNFVEVQDGHEYLLVLYVHNSGASNPDAAATDTKVMINLPNCSGKSIATNGFIQSLSAFPYEVWGGVNFRSTRRFSVGYVPDSAKVYSNRYPQGYAISGTDFLTSKGSLVGVDKMDGVIPGGYASSLNFSIKVKVTMN